MLHSSSLGGNGCGHISSATGSSCPSSSIETQLTGRSRVPPSQLLLHAPHGSVLVSYVNAFGGAVVGTAAGLVTVGAVSVGGGVDLVPDRRPGSIVSAGVVDVGAVPEIAGAISVAAGVTDTAGFEEAAGVTDAAGVTEIAGVIRVAVGAVKDVAGAVTEVAGLTEVAGFEDPTGSEVAAGLEEATASGGLTGSFLDLSLTINSKTLPLYLVLSMIMQVVAAATAPPSAHQPAIFCKHTT